MVTCNDIREWIHRKLDNELSAGEERELQRHLDQCACCRREWEELREITLLVAEVGNRDRIEPMTAVARRRTPRILRPLTIAMAIAALILVALTLYFIRPHLPAPQPVEPITYNDGTLEAVASSDDNVLVVNLPSRHPDVRIFWVYPIEPRKEF